MINKERLVNEFLEMVQITSLSRKEGKFAAYLVEKLKAMGLEVYVDNAGEKSQGETGNIIGRLKGTVDVPSILFGAHMDTVVPGENIKPQVRDGAIYSDGTTILGSDDKSGIAGILEAIRHIQESNIPHGDIEVLFTISEEGGLLGAKYLEYDKIQSKLAFELDSGGDVGNVIVQGPAQMKVLAKVIGKAAHAGVAPEKGINAIQVISKAISNMKLGRIDHETTANVGNISGGTATNIVCESVDAKFEARSLTREKVEAQVNHMVDCLKNACEEFNATSDIEVEFNYPPFQIGKDAEIVGLVEAAMKKIGKEANLTSTGGGSNTNIYNGEGIQAVTLATGMSNVHTTSEYITIDSLMSTAALVAAIIEVQADRA